MFLDKSEERNLPRDPRVRVHRQLSGDQVADQADQLRSKLVDLERQAARKRGGAPGPDVSREDSNFPDLLLLVEQETLALAVAEAGVVLVMDEDLEVERDVELDAHRGKRHAGGDAVEGGGDNLGFRVC